MACGAGNSVGWVGGGGRMRRVGSGWRKGGRLNGGS